jgi:DNA mismatch repair protein MutL
MPKIRRLNENLVKKIAAGQVVERPSSVVKELIENSLDAEATNIKIGIESGGTSLIKVTDDGLGMLEEDLLEAFKSYTTSKLTKEEDLFTIATLGFRGEALSSIASVSDLLIKSRPPQEISGTIIEVSNGELTRKGSIGMPPGTSVEVKDLFRSIPARRKFLKSASSEFRYVADVVITFALAHPHIGFFLSHNKRIVLDLPADQTISERVHLLLGSAIGKNILPVSFEDAHFSISGFVAKPQVASPIKSKQYLFVNRRPVTDKLVAGAVKDAFGTLLPPRNYPPFVLFFDLPTSMVDVNIHPRKEKVAFTDSKFVYDLFNKAIGDIFDKEDLTYSYDGDKEEDVFDRLMEGSEQEYAFIEENLPIFQLHNLYLIKQTQKGVLLVDQHAAHERILYEDLLSRFKDKDTVRFSTLINPITFESSVSDTEALTEYLDDYKKLGFEIDEFGKNTFKVSTIPWFVREESVVEIIVEILEGLKEGKGIKGLDTKTKHILSTMACKSAIKAGDSLNVVQREQLLKDLDKTKTKYTCPHGRPVKMELTMNELARMFKRK